MMCAQIIKKIAIIITHEIACKTYKIEIRQNRSILEYPLTEASLYYITEQIEKGKPYDDSILFVSILMIFGGVFFGLKE